MLWHFITTFCMISDVLIEISFLLKLVEEKNYRFDFRAWPTKITKKTYEDILSYNKKRKKIANKKKSKKKKKKKKKKTKKKKKKKKTQNKTINKTQANKQTAS